MNQSKGLFILLFTLLTINQQAFSQQMQTVIKNDTLSIKIEDNNYTVQQKDKIVNSEALSLKKLEKQFQIDKSSYITFLDTLIPAIDENRIEIDDLIVYVSDFGFGYRIHYGGAIYLLADISVENLASTFNYDISEYNYDKLNDAIEKLISKKRETKYNNFDKDYLSNAPLYERVRERYFLSPYLMNYAYLDLIDEPTENGKGEKCRPALKFQLSLKYPLFSYKYYHTGIYFAMTFKALFDLFETKNSQPVIYKNYMPELFGEYDIEQAFGDRHQSDISYSKHLIQLGAYHLSNGGSADTTHPIQTSRSLLVIPYGQYNFKMFPAKISNEPRSVYSSQYKLNIYTRITYYIPKWVEDNSNIFDYIVTYGYWGFDISGTYEHIFKDFGVVGIDIEFSPKKEYLNHGLGISFTPRWDPFDQSKNRWPVTFYLKYFEGYFEYLELYFLRRTVFAFGIKFRP